MAKKQEQVDEEKKAKYEGNAKSISDIESILNGQKVITYIGGLGIGPWDVSPLYGELRKIGMTDTLNVVLHSTGGYADDAYKIADLLHEFCKSLVVIVPLKAKSAATLLSLGANKIYMSPKSELGPCDPMIEVDKSLITPTVAVHGLLPSEGAGKKKKETRDMNALALRDFLEYAGILEKGSDGKYKPYNSEKLIPYIKEGILNIWLLGAFERSSKQGCQFAESLLRRYMFKNREDKEGLILQISNKLGEGYYHHSYPIGRREAKELGLEIEDMSEELSDKTTALVSDYEKIMEEQRIRRIIESAASFYIAHWTK